MTVDYTPCQWYWTVLDNLELDLGNGVAPVVYSSAARGFVYDDDTAYANWLEFVELSNAPAIDTLENLYDVLRDACPAGLPDGVPFSELAFREKLLADRILYVRVGGDDGNNGLVDSDQGAKFTVQAAIDEAAKLDLNGFNCRIIIKHNVGAGPDNRDVGTGLIAKSAIGDGSIIIEGYDADNPQSVILHTSGTPSNLQGLLLLNQCRTKYVIKNVYLKGANAGAPYCLHAIGAASFLEYSNVWFGEGFTIHVRAVDGANIFVPPSTSYKIRSGGLAHFNCQAGVLRCQFVTIDFQEQECDFSSAFATAADGGASFLNNNTFTNATNVTGKRFNTDGNGTIRINSADANYFPGNSAGTTATGGQIF